MPSTPPSGIPVATGSLRTPRLAIAAAFGVQGLLFISLTTRLPVLADLFDFDELVVTTTGSNDFLKHLTTAFEDGISHTASVEANSTGRVIITRNNVSHAFR